MNRLLRRLRARYHPLHQLRKLRWFRALAARLDLPLWVRLPGVDWPVRLRLVRSASYLLNRRTPEPEMVALFIALDELYGPRTFWDVGANVGYYGWLLKSRDAARQVWLFEPDPDNARLIRQTLSRAGVQGVRLVAAAASDASGSAAFAVDPVTSATGAVLAGGSPRPYAARHFGVKQAVVQVPTVTLDSLWTDGLRVDLLKVDVEGHERAVFRGAHQLLAGDQPVVIFECFQECDPIFDQLRELGYELLDAERLDEGLGRAINYLALPRRCQATTAELVARWRAQKQALGL